MKKQLSRHVVVTSGLVTTGLLILGAIGAISLSRTTDGGIAPGAAAQNSSNSETATGGKQPACEPVGPRKNGILLVYPHDGSTINSPATYMIGTVRPGTELTVNGQSVPVNRSGYFAQPLPLAVGDNQFTIIANADQSQQFQFSVKRPAPSPPVAAEPLQILRSSLEPRQDRGVQPGDLIQFSLRGSPGAQAVVTIGTRQIKLSQPGDKSGVNVGRDTAFGVAYQQSPASMKDLYTGFYRVTASDNWSSECPVFTLTRGESSVRETAPGKVTVLGQPFVATTAHADTVVRVGPGAGRTTPLADGVRVLVDGYVGDSLRCEMSAGKHLWIDKNDLAQSPENTGVPPTALVRTINIENDGNGGARIVVPLDQRLPYEVKQEITPQNRLLLKIYGATADTDWVTEPGTSSKSPSGSTGSEACARAGHAQGKTYPPAAERARNPVSFLTWQQAADRLYQVTVTLNQRQQWGYWLDYEDTNLVLHIKGKPELELGGGSLRGLKICIDPGHGGLESGTIGCSGTKEATLNLEIAKRVERLLRERGATTVMTRTGDVDVSLADRVAVAVRNKVDLLVSIHNNSLPDGRNPLTEHGTSSYYYHPQSLGLATHIRAGEVRNLGFNDYHTRWQNLFLCRPSQMPAQLVEVGFMNNPDELTVLLSASGQEKAALGIVQGIHSFLSEACSTEMKNRPREAVHGTAKRRSVIRHN